MEEIESFFKLIARIVRFLQYDKLMAFVLFYIAFSIGVLSMALMFLIFK